MQSTQFVRSGVTTAIVYVEAPSGWASGWTVKRTRNGAAGVTYTTPTIAEVTNIPGLYALTLDEDTTISVAGNENMLLLFTNSNGPGWQALVPVVLFKNDVTHMNGAQVQGNGTSGNKWRG